LLFLFKRGNAIATLAGYNRAIGNLLSCSWEEGLQLHKSFDKTWVYLRLIDVIREMNAQTNS